MCPLPWCINFTSTGFSCIGGGASSHAISAVRGWWLCISFRSVLDHTHTHTALWSAGFHAVSQVPGPGSVVRRASSAPRAKGDTLAKLSSAGQDLLDALARFTYFDRWSDEQRRDCCHRAQIRQFEPDQTVFVEGQAPVNYAHFMLSGECGLLQCLKLHWRRDRRTGAKRYRLSRAQPTEDEITRFYRRRRQQTMDASGTEEHVDVARYLG
ncbi:uncharacterized protein LOC118510018 [Anopheles stephensi]|uniref:uncharacterized protein LOC118510018 n=1 Tax=Anopheles stephensi TaxID=30069 RepID=UPI0016587D31|nr:uncharacterized protein LOC118510018 [Anopheles stephensi]